MPFLISVMTEYLPPSGCDVIFRKGQGFRWAGSEELAGTWDLGWAGAIRPHLFVNLCSRLDTSYKCTICVLQDLIATFISESSPCQALSADRKPILNAQISTMPNPVASRPNQHPLIPFLFPTGRLSRPKPSVTGQLLVEKGRRPLGSGIGD